MNDFSPNKLIEGELKKLKTNEEKVIRERFGLLGKKMTLAAIGRDLKLSRERVRQIERDAKRKLSMQILEDHKVSVEKILDSMKKHGGIVHKQDAAKKLLSEKIKDSEKEASALGLFIALLPDIEEIERDDILHDSWKLITLPKSEVAGILKEWAKYLESSKSPKQLDVILENHPAHNKHNVTFLNAVSKVGRNIMEAHDGSIGLTKWPRVNPRTVRDKIFYILIKNQKPLHFSEITEEIKRQEFDQKKVVTATVHNELIADERFVLIGRGIYALKEWGYTEGTVKDVIYSVLKKSKKAMDLKDIYNEVQKQRVVRKNTILINLQTQKDFKKVGTSSFTLK